MWVQGYLCSFNSINVLLASIFMKSKSKLSQMSSDKSYFSICSISFGTDPGYQWQLRWQWLSQKLVVGRGCCGFFPLCSVFSISPYMKINFCAKQTSKIGNALAENYQHIFYFLLFVYNVGWKWLKMQKQPKQRISADPSDKVDCWSTRIGH